MPTITTSILPPAVQASFDQTLLSTPTRNFIYNVAAQRRKKTANSGDVVRYMRFNQLDSALVPLGNSGITPPASTLTAIYVDAKMSFYGSWLAVNEQVQLQHQCPILNQAAIRLGVQMRLTEDDLTKNMLAATANMINCTNGISADLPTEINPTDLLDATTRLQSADALTISQMIEAENKFGTGPVYSAFWCMTHTNMIPSLTGMAGFLPKYQYPRQENVLNSELGAFAYSRFLVSSAGSTTPNGSVLNQTVYNNIIVGGESYGIIDQDNYGPSFIYLPPQYSGPMALNSTVAWKTAMVPRIFNDQWVCLLRSTLPQ
jgi:N4-gp56 family major capsid protein